MKIRIPRRLTSLILAGTLSTGLACAKKVENHEENINTEEEIELIEDNANSYQEMPIEEEFEISNNEEESLEEEILDNIELSYYVVATENVNIRSKRDKNSEKLGILFKGQSLKMIDEYKTWIKVEYDGKKAYISKEYLEIVQSYDFPNKVDIPVIDSDKDAYYYLRNISFVKATGKVNVRRETNTDCEVLGQLSKGDRVLFVSDLGEWYQVEYNGENAYVYSKYAKITTECATEVSDIVFMISKTSLYDIDTFEKIDRIPKNELAEVYAEYDNYYLVKYDGTYGYVEKKHTQSLGDNYVVIDISSQNLKVYVDDKVIIDTPIVTGKDSSPTYCGVFDVYKKERNVYWPEFDVTVKYGLAFNRGEWMHDASWRKKFGGQIYHEDGSHGCVNIPKNVMDDVYENVEIGTPVLVKK